MTPNDGPKQNVWCKFVVVCVCEREREVNCVVCDGCVTLSSQSATIQTLCVWLFLMQEVLLCLVAKCTFTQWKNYSAVVCFQQVKHCLPVTLEKDVVMRYL